MTKEVSCREAELWKLNIGHVVCVGSSIPPQADALVQVVGMHQSAAAFKPLLFFLTIFPSFVNLYLDRPKNVSRLIF